MPRCHYCNVAVTENIQGQLPRWSDRTRDHLIPKCTADPGARGFTVIACRRCNLTKNQYLTAAQMMQVVSALGWWVS